jgi:hypothetical protein
MSLFSEYYNYDHLSQSDDEEDPEFDYQVLNKEVQSTTNTYEFYEHIILPSDTLQGICLQYKIKPTKLRQMNRFSGSNLNLAPKKLLIPKFQNGVGVREQDRTTKEFKVHFVIATYQFMNLKEATSYLEIFEWDLGNALKSIESDLVWESVHSINGPLKRLTLRENICTFNDNFRRKRTSQGYNDNEPLLEVSVGLPLGVNRYVWKEFGIEMKNLPQLADSRFQYGGPTIAPIHS